jgi:hypothetical protein
MADSPWHAKAKNLLVILRDHRDKLVDFTATYGDSKCNILKCARDEFRAWW